MAEECGPFLWGGTLIAEIGVGLATQVVQGPLILELPPFVSGAGLGQTDLDAQASEVVADLALQTRDVTAIEHAGGDAGLAPQLSQSGNRGRMERDPVGRVRLVATNAVNVEIE